MKSHSPNPILPVLTGLLILLLGQGQVRGTTLVGMGIDRIADQAQLIFEGEVISRQVQRESGTGLIHTYVVFRILDVLKGEAPRETLELRFTGGEIDGEVIEISGLDIPEVSEQGIYFVESTSRALLNPLLGWSQGRFLIRDEDGERHIRTASDQAVTAVQPAANIPALIRRPQALNDGTGKVAHGIVTDANAVSFEKPLTVDEFKQRIRALIKQRP